MRSSIMSQAEKDKARAILKGQVAEFLANGGVIEQARKREDDIMNLPYRAIKDEDRLVWKRTQARVDGVYQYFT